MVTHPCDARLVPGIHGDSEGLLARLKTTYTVSNNATCGFIVWDPSYSSSPDDGGFSMVIWTDDDSTKNPQNDATIAYGNGAFSAMGSETAEAVNDPCHDFLDSDIVEDARLISACITMTYFGTVIDASGQVGFLENLPEKLLLEGGTGGTPVSVDELFKYTANTHRLGLDRFEVMSRPTEGAIRFREGVQAPFDIGVNGTNASAQSAMGQTTPSSLCGIVWRSTDSKSRLVLEITKNIEWRPSPLSGLTLTHPFSSGRTKLPIVEKIADKKAPGWSTRISSGGTQMPHFDHPSGNKSSFWSDLIENAQTAKGVYDAGKGLLDMLEGGAGGGGLGLLEDLLLIA